MILLPGPTYLILSLLALNLLFYNLSREWTIPAPNAVPPIVGFTQKSFLTKASFNAFQRRTHDDWWSVAVLFAGYSTPIPFLIGRASIVC